MEIVCLIVALGVLPIVLSYCEDIRACVLHFLLPGFILDVGVLADGYVSVRSVTTFSFSWFDNS